MPAFPSVQMLALEPQRGALLRDDPLKIEDLFRIHVVLDSLEFLLGALDCFLGGGFIDLAFAQGHVRKHNGLVVPDFRKAGADRQSDDLPLAQIPESLRAGEP